jgi:hypothetical protein
LVASGRPKSEKQEAARSCNKNGGRPRCYSASISAAGN